MRDILDGDHNGGIENEITIVNQDAVNSKTPSSQLRTANQSRVLNMQDLSDTQQLALSSVKMKSGNHSASRNDSSVSNNFVPVKNSHK